MEDKLSFEQAMQRLAYIAQQLEGNSLSLDESMQLFEEGLALIKMCNTTLKNYEEKINDVVVSYQDEPNDESVQ